MKKSFKYLVLFGDSGGGFALSDASDVSGLSFWIGEQMISLKDLHEVLILFIVMIMTACITEVASNTATANVLIPILISLVISHRLYTFYTSSHLLKISNFNFLITFPVPETKSASTLSHTSSNDYVFLRIYASCCNSSECNRKNLLKSS